MNRAHKHRFGRSLWGSVASLKHGDILPSKDLPPNATTPKKFHMVPPFSSSPVQQKNLCIKPNCMNWPWNRASKHLSIWKVANAIKLEGRFLSPAFKFKFSSVFSMERMKHPLFHIHPFSYSLFLDPRTVLNNACQKLFGRNRRPEYINESRGPPHNLIWTTVIKS